MRVKKWKSFIASIAGSFTMKREAVKYAVLLQARKSS
jgi:hypothetical protein